MYQMKLPFRDMKIKALADLFYYQFGFWTDKWQSLNWAEDMITRKKYNLYLSDDFTLFNFTRVEGVKRFKIFIRKKDEPPFRGGFTLDIRDDVTAVERREFFDPKVILPYVE